MASNDVINSLTCGRSESASGTFWLFPAGNPVLTLFCADSEVRIKYNASANKINSKINKIFFFIGIHLSVFRLPLFVIPARFAGASARRAQAGIQNMKHKHYFIKDYFKRKTL